MSPAAADRWEYVRAGGRAKFVWLKGVLLWGAATGVCVTVFAAGVTGPAGLARVAPASAVVFPVAGYFYGRWVWRVNEAAYRRARGLPAGDAGAERPAET